MKKEFILAILTCSIFIFSLQSCDDDDPVDPDPITDLNATDATFADFTSWTLEATENGVGSSSLGTAHAGTDPDSERKIYFKDGQDAVNGVYPIGTLVGKTVETADGFSYFGMVKRAVDYDVDGNNWEYFVLAADGSITSRGADLNNGNCQGCHSVASATDFIFSK